jgi:hypothetical protein
MSKLTKAQVLAIAKAMLDGAEREIVRRDANAGTVYAVRGACLAALDNLWYDVCTPREREFWKRDRQAFLSVTWHVHAINTDNPVKGYVQPA